MLDTTLFKKFNVINSGEFDYIGFIPIGHPMILFSLVDGSPLASLHLRYQLNSNNPRYQTLITELNESTLDQQKFQGIFTKDDCDIEFVITNLSHEGFINFNLMKTDTKVFEVDPGGLNKVNELKPYQSYSVKADQTANNKSIKLSVNIKKDNDNKEFKTELVKEISQKNEDKVGSYLYLSVIPKNDVPQLCDKFKETIWKPSDYFVIKKKSISTNQGTLFFGDDEILQSFTHNNTDSSEDSEEESGDMGGSLFEDCLTNNKMENDIILQSKTFIPLTNQIKKNNNDDIFESSHSDIYKSHVANISHGQQLIVNSNQTGFDYAYDLHSRKCILGISVFENLKITDKPNINYVKQYMEEYVDKLINDGLSNLLKEMKMIYPSDSCCLCLEDEPNTVFYKCGHKCVHSKCLNVPVHPMKSETLTINKCPLCREHIYHKIFV